MKLSQSALVAIAVCMAAGDLPAQTGITSYIDGFDGGNPAPTVFNQIIVGDFEDGDGAADAQRQGWRPVRMANLESFGGALTNRNGGGFGTNDNGEGDNYIRLDTDRVTALPAVPDSFVVGELPGQYNVFQFDLRYDEFPPEDPNSPGTGLIESRLKGAAFFQGSVTRSANFLSNSELQALKDANDTSFHTYTIVRDFNVSDWGATQDILRVDPADGISRFDAVGTSAVLGTKFTIDNIILGRTTATEAFPAIAVSVPNIIRNGDLSQVSNLVLSGDNDGAADINGGNGNFGPFRGSSVDVDHWAPYNNNPNGIVEAVNGPDGTGLNLLNIAGTQQGSFYLDSHWSTGSELFSLNSAGGYLNGMIQTDVLNGVAIDPAATYELSFDLSFNETRPANPSSNFKVALTVGTDSTDSGTAVAGSLFDNQLSNITAGDTQTLSISGAALQAAQDTGDPINLIVQSQANTSIVNFPGTPVPDNHRDSAVFTQVQVDNFSLVKAFVPQPGDVNKDGVVTQADVTLAQLYHDGNGGETAEKRQNDLFAAPSAPLRGEILASLNLNDFDLVAPFDFFDQADVDAIAALVTTAPGDADGDGDIDGADFLLLQRTDPSQISTWQSNYGSGATSAATAVPEPTSLVLTGLSAMFSALLGYRRSSREMQGASDAQTSR